MEKERSRLIPLFTGSVINIMSLGQPLERALELASVPYDYLEEVKAGVLARVG